MPNLYYALGWVCNRYNLIESQNGRSVPDQGPELPKLSQLGSSRLVKAEANVSLSAEYFLSILHVLCFVCLWEMSSFPETALRFQDCSSRCPFVCRILHFS